MYPCLLHINSLRRRYTFNKLDISKVTFRSRVKNMKRIEISSFLQTRCGVVRKLDTHNPPTNLPLYFFLPDLIKKKFLFYPVFYIIIFLYKNFYIQV